MDAILNFKTELSQLAWGVSTAFPEPNYCLKRKKKNNQATGFKPDWTWKKQNLNYFKRSVTLSTLSVWLKSNFTINWYVQCSKLFVFVWEKDPSVHEYRTYKNAKGGIMWGSMAAS